MTTPTRTERALEAGYKRPEGILEGLAFTLVENSFQFDEIIHLLQTKTTDAKLDVLIDLQTQILQTLREKPLSSLSSGQVDKPKTLTIEGKTYDSPKLFEAIAWLEANPDKRDLSVRAIADILGISKSWIAIAKKHNSSATD